VSEEKELTAEYVTAYMEGSVATRKEITDLIVREMTTRQGPPPAQIKYWTEYLLELINSNGRNPEEILQESGERVVMDMIKHMIMQDIMEEQDFMDEGDD
jgi:hypothetical protein